MNWPDLWVPINDSAASRPLGIELQGELSLGHQLFGLPLQVLGRRLDTDDVLVGIQDGSGRVASIHLTWSGRPESPPWPSSNVYESFAAWHAAEWNAGTSSPDDDLDIVRAALRRWDPIGIHPEWPECPAKDEYDRYAPGVLELLREGASEADLAGYLRKLRTEQMWVSWDLPLDETIARELIQWWSVKR